MPRPVVRCGVLVLGDAKSGKTAIIKRRKALTYESDLNQSHLLPQVTFTAAYDPTIGVELHHNVPYAPASCDRLWRLKEPPNDGGDGLCRVVCSLYDLSGSPAFAKALNGWYSEAVRLTEEKQLSDANAHPFSHRIRGIVVGAKNDAAGSGSGDAKSARSVSEAEGKDWAQTHELSYFECSAKTGYNITALFDALVLIASNTSGTVPNPQRSPYTPLATTAAGGGGAGGAVGGSGSGSGGGVAAAAPDKMSVWELKKELTAMGVDTSDVLEKKELIARYISAMNGGGKYSMKIGGTASLRSQPTASGGGGGGSPNSKDNGGGGGYTKEQQQTIERISSELETFTATYRDIRSILNAVLEVSSTAPDFLKPNAAFDLVQKSYRKALLRIHPDKTSRSDFAAHYKTTELFKIVNEKWHAYHKANQAALSGGAATATATTPTAAAAPMTTPTAAAGATAPTRKPVVRLGAGFTTGSAARKWQ